MPTILQVVAPLLLLAALAASAPAQTVLFDFDRGFDFAKVQATDASAAEAKRDGGSALAIRTGHKEPWPGVVLAAPGGAWDLAAHTALAMEVRNTGAAPVTVHCRVDNAGADGTNHCNTGSVDLKPGQAGTLRVPFRRRGGGPAGIKLFGMRGYPMPQDDKGTIDPAKVIGLVIFVGRPTADHAFEVDAIRAEGAYAAPPEAILDPARFFPMIDRFGQYVHRDWPGRTRAATDMDDFRKEEEAGLRVKTGPKDWNAYGGWKDGPALEATGFFRAARHEGRWWLVDPEGRLFWSHGIDCVRHSSDTPIEDREAWFADLPKDDPAFAAFFGSGRAIHGHYKGRQVRTFDFGAANLLRKYGQDWRRLASETAHRRLRSWGMNTVGNWSDADVCLMRKTSYVGTVWFSSKPIQGSTGYWGQFKDPFEPEFSERLRARMAQEAGKTAGDPWCIGYFVDNEIAWGDDTSLALAALASPADQAAKKALLEDLRAKYGEIGKLNAAWGTGHASWDALAASTTPPDKKRAAEDLGAFYTRVAEQYFRLCRDAVKAVAPDQMYLGCRFAWVNARAAAAGAKYCDVVSYNLYRRSVADFRMPAGLDRPVIIGEFHFGALDRGMFHTGLVPTASQSERAEAYKAYVQGALANPLIVGTHWFQYRDQATTGRPLDEENYQIGFVDIGDRPYPETVAACREVGQAMYALRSGRR